MRACALGLLILLPWLAGCAARHTTPSSPQPPPRPDAPTPSATEWPAPQLAELPSRELPRSALGRLRPELAQDPREWPTPQRTLRGHLEERKLADEHEVAVRGGHCYRMHLQVERGVRSLAVVARDADYRVLFDEGGDWLPALGAWCADRDGALRLAVAASIGSGAYTLAISERRAAP